MHNVKSPPVNLDKYLEGDKKRYLTYEEAARRYSMPYWTFVNLAKEAGATWVLRKTAMVDIDKLDAYLDKNYAVAGNKNESEKREVMKMPRTRKEVEGMEELGYYSFSSIVSDSDTIGSVIIISIDAPILESDEKLAVILSKLLSGKFLEN